MRVTNTSQYDLTRLHELLQFAAKGTRDSSVEVHIKNGRGVAGMTYDRPLPLMCRVAKTTKYLITLRIPSEDNLPERTYSGLSRIDKAWPDGIPFESWEDAFVDLAAHEFRHVWQFQRSRRTGKGGKGEYDADKHAMNTLNRWREITGREAVPAVKQPNPFANVKKAAKTEKQEEKWVGIPFSLSELKDLEGFLGDTIKYYDYALANRRVSFYPTESLEEKRRCAEALLRKLIER